MLVSYEPRQICIATHYQDQYMLAAENINFCQTKWRLAEKHRYPLRQPRWLRVVWVYIRHGQLRLWEVCVKWRLTWTKAFRRLDEEWTRDQVYCAAFVQASLMVEIDCDDRGRRLMVFSRLQPDGKTGNTELMTSSRNILSRTTVRDFDASQRFLEHPNWNRKEWKQDKQNWDDRQEQLAIRVGARTVFHIGTSPVKVRRMGGR